MGIGAALAGRRDDRGAIALISALVAVVLLIVSAFVVDIGSTWARRGQLQVQADRAALLAAEDLPATTESAKQRVAAVVAYYIACHPVSGQGELSPDIPSCPSGTTPSTPSVVAYGTRLLERGQVSFPTTTQVKVVTPPARIEFGFGRTAGVEESIQQKTAIAKVMSPGDIMPIGLSMNCLLVAANNLPAGLGDTLTGVLPLNYIAPGPLRPVDDQGPAPWPQSDSAGTRPTIESFTTAPTALYQGAQGTFTITGTSWGVVSLAGLLEGAEVWFSRPSLSEAVEADATLSLGAAGLGTATGALPSEVTQTPGEWEVKVHAKPATAWRWSDAVSFQVALPTVTADLLGCGRLMKSPRDFQDGTPGNLTKNLQEGLDHGLTSHSRILSVTPPSPVTVPSLLTTLGDTGGLFQCSNASPDVPDIGGNLQNGHVPNCMVLAQGGSSVYDELTEGMLGAPRSTATGVVAGRLVCTDARPCEHDTFTIDEFPGRTLNDDDFDDYVLDDRRNLLTEEMFFDLTTFLTPGLPAATPESALDPAIYGSHRFFWVPILSTPQSPNGNDAGAYPILTFRPVFVTQDHPSGLDSIDLVLDVVTGWVRTLLGITGTDDHGVITDGDTLRALRFMTIEPSALPTPCDSLSSCNDYHGPTSEYVGTGPKIVRLVR